MCHTLSGQENKVRENLEKQIKQEDVGCKVYEVLIPTEKVSEVRNGRKTTMTRKYFPAMSSSGWISTTKTA
jgi:transcriptional antiterminator NusG